LKLLIIDLDDNEVGYVEKLPDGYEVSYKGELIKTAGIPRIMQDIAPGITQELALPTILEYFDMSTYNLWEYFVKSNGFKTSRNIYFVAEPPGQVWVPLREERNFSMYMNPGDEVVIRGDGGILVNRHRNIKLPYYLARRINIESAVYGKTDITGYVHDVRSEGLFMGVRARLVLDFPVSSLLNPNGQFGQVN
jgi:hypothetical protein